MNTAILLEKLFQIEKAVVYEKPSTVQAMLRDTQDAVLELQAEVIGALHEVETLRLGAAPLRRPLWFRRSGSRLRKSECE